MFVIGADGIYDFLAFTINKSLYIDLNIPTIVPIRPAEASPRHWDLS